MGAWIEIAMRRNIDNGKLSLPLWERGLKSIKELNNMFNEMSLPLWEGGLKYK